MSLPRRGTVPTLAAVLLMGTGGVFHADAQERVGQETSLTPSSLRHIQEVEPRSGPPGTEVRIYSENIPPQGKVLVGIGAIGVGFEVLSEGTQGRWGDVTAALAIPESAPWDRSIRVIFLNGLFSPIALSDPFHVTDQDGLVRRVGSVVRDGAGCVALEDDHGDIYALDGSPDALAPGSEVAVEGRWTSGGDCGADGTLEVVRVMDPPAERPDSPPPPL